MDIFDSGETLNVLLCIVIDTKLKYRSVNKENSICLLLMNMKKAQSDEAVVSAAQFGKKQCNSHFILLGKNGSAVPEGLGKEVSLSTIRVYRKTWPNGPRSQTEN